VRPPDPPDAAWIGPPGIAPPRQKKKKAALTPKEALRAKVQARAARHPAPAKQATRDAEPENARDDEEAPPYDVDADRAVTKAAPKPTLLQRFLGVFRKTKPPPPDDE
jgi:hypothetical protein